MGAYFKNRKNRLILIQILGWGLIIGTTLLWSIDTNGKNTFNDFGIAQLSISILELLLIYLLNYWIFIPMCLFKNKRTQFVLSNLALIIVLLICAYYTNEKGVLSELRPGNRPSMGLGGTKPLHNHPKMDLFFMVRGTINYILMIGLVTAFRLSEKLRKSQEALKEAESARVTAELTNLKSQLNPHFLLNTLNNIYALTTINTDKAQKAIKELSSLLRYVLYENNNNSVALHTELEFIKTYIELMSIRLPHKVTLTTKFNIPENSTTQVAPLLFISLIENAFKHSVSASGEGYIDIFFEENREKGEITLDIINSNNAKTTGDKSGHGIGLEQVQKRLELLYPNSYTWDIKQTEENYSSILIIQGTSKNSLTQNL